MDPDAVYVLIPVVALAGFFGWLIARTLTKGATARLEAQGRMRLLEGGDREEILSAVDDLRRQVAELAERVDFAERLLAKHPGELGRGRSP